MKLHSVYPLISTNKIYQQTQLTTQINESISLNQFIGSHSLVGGRGCWRKNLPVQEIEPIASHRLLLHTTHMTLPLPYRL